MALLSTIMVSAPLTPGSGLAPQTLALLFRELPGPPAPPSHQGHSHTVILGRDLSLTKLWFGARRLIFSSGLVLAIGLAKRFVRVFP